MLRRNLLALFPLSICVVVSANAHDLFLKLNSYFLQPNSSATVRLMNGDFCKSENAVSRDRKEMNEASLNYESKWASLTFEIR